MARQREDPRRTAREHVGAFLSGHRGLVSPQQAGLPSGIGHRRVQGLRREEVALLAGISVEYYAKLERGAIGDVSPQVVDALARVLQLSTAEREHLDRLVHTSSGWVAPAVASRTQVVVRPELQRVLDLLEPAAAFVRNGRLDVLATNAPGRALYANVMAGRTVDRAPNLARYLFCDKRAHHTYTDWDLLADNAVGTLRGELGRHPHDADLQELVAELMTSPEFVRRWDDHTVRRYRSGKAGFRTNGSDEVIELNYEALDVVSDPGLTVLVYSAEPGTQAAARLASLV